MSCYDPEWQTLVQPGWQTQFGAHATTELLKKETQAILMKFCTYRSFSNKFLYKSYKSSIQKAAFSPPVV